MSGAVCRPIPFMNSTIRVDKELRGKQLVASNLSAFLGSAITIFVLV